jgi:hypothetical protein
MTYSIRYRIGQHPYAKRREVQRPTQPSNDEARTLIAEWWKCAESEIAIESVVEVAEQTVTVEVLGAKRN